MKNITTIILFLICNFTFAQTIKQKIEQLSKLKFEYMIQKNTVGLDKLLHKDLNYIHSNGWVENKIDLLKNIKNEELIYHKVIPLETKVLIKKNMAIITGKGEFEVTYQKQRFTIILLYTETYLKSNHKWLLINRHACKPMN